MTWSRAHRQTIVLLLVGALAAALGGFSMGSATGAPPAPVEIRLDSIASTTGAPAGTDPKSVPGVLAVTGQTLTVTVSFLDSSGRAASFSKDTRITVTAGTTRVTSVDTLVPKDRTSWPVQVAVPDPDNRVRLRVAFSAGKVTYSDTATDSQVFDVLTELRTDTVASDTAIAPGIGGEGTCAQATRARPVCGVLVLPRGTKGSQVLMSLGPCDDAAYSGCSDGAVVQALADLSGYTTTAPATFLVRCDKSLCGQGPIQQQPVFWQITGDDALERASACPAKGTMPTAADGTPGDPCVDWVQSKRDGSGDTYFYVLFADDARVSVG